MLPSAQRRLGGAMRALSCTTMASALTCVLCCPLAASAATVSEKAKESGCVNKPIVISGTMYRCLTQSAAYSYFNVPGAPVADPPDNNGSRKTATTPTPAGFPKIDSATQKGRDDVRRKVLGDELATEEKLLAQARTAYAEGAPSALPEERANVEKYRERIAKLRQAVSVHEKNVEALKKELASGR
jgi:hypothetical protein